jgi:5-methylcytosine-specific restriction endonuclease McrA
MNLGAALMQAVSRSESDKWKSTLDRIEERNEVQRKLDADLKHERAQWTSRFGSNRQTQYELRKRLRQEMDREQRDHLGNELDGAEKQFWVIYSEYLQSCAWQYKRQGALERDKSLCQHCASPATEVHHENYDYVGDEPLYQLLSLCTVCHKKIHDKKNRDRAESLAHARAGTLKEYLDDKNKHTNAIDLRTLLDI